MSSIALILIPMFGADNRETITWIFLNNRTTALLGDNSDIVSAASLVTAVLMLEKYNQTEHVNPMSALEKDVDRLRNLDVFEECDHSLLEFYLKRIPCSCLDETNAAIESEAKTGVCDHCKQRKERGYLIICTGCQFYQYCSRECMKAD